MPIHKNNTLRYDNFVSENDITVKNGRQGNKRQKKQNKITEGIKCK